MQQKQKVSFPQSSATSENRGGTLTQGGILGARWSSRFQGSSPLFLRLPTSNQCGDMARDGLTKFSFGKNPGQHKAKKNSSWCCILPSIIQLHFFQYANIAMAGKSRFCNGKYIDSFTKPQDSGVNSQNEVPGWNPLLNEVQNRLTTTLWGWVIIGLKEPRLKVFLFNLFLHDSVLFFGFAFKKQILNQKNSRKWSRPICKKKQKTPIYGLDILLSCPGVMMLLGQL